MLTDVARRTAEDERRTTHDDGRQPIAIGHLSDSSDLNITHITKSCRTKKANLRLHNAPQFKEMCKQEDWEAEGIRRLLTKNLRLQPNMRKITKQSIPIGTKQ